MLHHAIPCCVLAYIQLAVTIGTHNACDAFPPPCFTQNEDSGPKRAVAVASACCYTPQDASKDIDAEMQEVDDLDSEVDLDRQHWGRRSDAEAEARLQSIEARPQDASGPKETSSESRPAESRPEERRPERPPPGLMSVGGALRAGGMRHQTVSPIQVHSMSVGESLRAAAAGETKPTGVAMDAKPDPSQTPQEQVQQQKSEQDKKQEQKPQEASKDAQKPEQQQQQQQAPASSPALPKALRRLLSAMQH